MAKAPPSAKRDRIKAFTPALVDYTNDVIYGDLWERKALSKRDRSLITVAALVATYRPEQLVSHLSRAMAEKSDVIFTSLPEPTDVERVSLGADGLIEGVKKGTAYFDLSTNSQSVVKKIHDAFAAKGAHMLDAPVSGGPSGAASRKMA